MGEGMDGADAILLFTGDNPAGKGVHCSAARSNLYWDVGTPKAWPKKHFSFSQTCSRISDVGSLWLTVIPVQIYLPILQDIFSEIKFTVRVLFTFGLCFFWWVVGIFLHAIWCVCVCHGTEICKIIRCCIIWGFLALQRSESLQNRLLDASVSLPPESTLRPSFSFSIGFPTYWQVFVIYLCNIWAQLFEMASWRNIQSHFWAFNIQCNIGSKLGHLTKNIFPDHIFWRK